jgi:hypothetical protein
VVGEIALVVDRDVGADQPGLASPHIRVGLLQRGAASRRDFTSVPVSTMPASTRSRRW